MIRVNSEVERLRRVVVQAPGPALERMMPEHIVPESSKYLLFDDLVDVPVDELLLVRHPVLPHPLPHLQVLL